MSDPTVPSAETPSWYRSAAVRQVPYDPAWPALYADEAALIEEALGAELVALEHVGSTAVAGLSAKPIIDILASVRTWYRFDQMADALATLGYVYTPHSEADDPERRVLRKPADMSLDRTHHLHITEAGSRYWVRIVAFRDTLRADASLSRAYATLKNHLAARFEHDRDRYTRGKQDFVRMVEQRSAAPPR